MMPNQKTMEPTHNPARNHRALVKLLLRKAVTVAVVTVLFGWLYSWASARRVRLRSAARGDDAALAAQPGHGPRRDDLRRQ